MKQLTFDKKYFFDLDGNYVYEGKTHFAELSEMIALTTNGREHHLTVKWLSLCAHYELDVPDERLLDVYYTECRNKVIGLKCGELMSFKKLICESGEFFIIPGFTGFAITRDGIVRSRRYGRILKPSINPYGYPYVNVYDPDKGRWRSVCLHLLIARTFIRNMEPGFRCFVNHIDGNKTNFSISNLEWVSSRENQVHAVGTGLRRDNVECEVRDVRNGLIRTYPSISEALRSLGYSGIKSITRTVGNEVIPVLFKGSFEIRSKSVSNDWFYTSENMGTVRMKAKGPFQALRLSDNREFESVSVRSLSRQTSVTVDKILGELKRHQASAIDGFLFREKSSEAWPTTYTASAFTPPRKFKVIDLESNHCVVCNSLRNLTKLLGLDKRTVKNALKNGGLYQKWLIEEIRIVIS